MCLVPLLQPRVHCPQLPPMSLSDEIWLCSNIQNTITVPVVPGSVDQQLILTISDIVVSSGRIGAVVAQIIPNVT